VIGAVLRAASLFLTTLRQHLPGSLAALASVLVFVNSCAATQSTAFHVDPLRFGLCLFGFGHAGFYVTTVGTFLKPRL